MNINKEISKIAKTLTSGFGVGSPDGPNPKFKKGDKVKTYGGYSEIWSVGDYDDYAKDRRYIVMNPDTHHKLNMFEKNIKKASVNFSAVANNHKDFNTKKEALAFLDDHALMSVGWKEGNKKKVAIYWNGKVNISDADHKKYWGSNRRASDKLPKRFWAIKQRDKVVTSGNDVGITLQYLQDLAKKHNGEVIFGDKSFAKQQEVGDIFGYTWEQIRNMQQGRKSSVLIAGGWGRFSEELTDLIEAQVNMNKDKQTSMIMKIIKENHSILDMMQDEGMTDRELTKFIEETKRYNKMIGR